MKNFAFITVLASLAFMTACGGGSIKKKISDLSGTIEEKISSDVPKIKKLPFEHGSYVEVTEALGTEMKKTVYFDKWGEWTATQDKSEIEIIKGYTSKTDKLDIVKGKTHWNIDFIEKTGTQYEAAEFSAGMGAILGAAMSAKMTEGMEIEELGTEDYLGYPCKKIHIKYKDMDMDVTTVTYENLTMQMDGKVSGMEVKSKIISIDLTPPPASIFEVPEGIEIQKY